MLKMKTFKDRTNAGKNWQKGLQSIRLRTMLLFWGCRFGAAVWGCAFHL
jgi:hypothetical protein